VHYYRAYPSECGFCGAYVLQWGRSETVGIPTDQLRAAAIRLWMAEASGRCGRDSGALREMGDNIQCLLYATAAEGLLKDAERRFEFSGGTRDPVFLPDVRGLLLTVLEGKALDAASPYGPPVWSASSPEADAYAAAPPGFDARAIGAVGVWQLENAVYARHGKPFEDPDLSRLFYESPRPEGWTADRHITVDLPTFAPDPAYDDSRLTDIDLANLAIIAKIERDGRKLEGW
jgi:hypothetical protein